MEKIIKNILKELKNGKVDERIISYHHHPQYAILKDSATVTIRLKDGLEAVIDITDLVL